MVLASILVLIILSAILYFSVSSTKYSLLYSGLDDVQSGELVKALEKSSVAFKVNGNSIYVDSNERDKLRMSLAADGLPAPSSSGYELLDGLNGFGTTSKMFDATYWRAKEGELARTISTSPLIRSARVHIAWDTSRQISKSSITSASVVVLANGSSLNARHSEAIKFLISTAVGGISSSDISVIDGASGRIIEGQNSKDYEISGLTRESNLKTSVTQLLEAHVGLGRARVEVNITPITDRVEIFERRLDPKEKVTVSSEITELKDKSVDGDQSSVTVASNVPAGDGNSQGGGASSEKNEIKERTNFDFSESKSETVKNPGGIKRLTVAVMVDGRWVSNDDGLSTWQPRDDQELNDLSELVKAAIGFDENRGDVVTIRTLQFEDIPGSGSEPIFSPQTGSMDLTKIVQSAILGLVSLLIAFFVIRPMFMRNESEPLRTQSAEIASSTQEGLPGLGSYEEVGALDSLDNSAAPELDLPPLQPMSAFDDISIDGSGGNFDETDSDPGKRLSELALDRREDTVEVLRDWLGQEMNNEGAT